MTKVTVFLMSALFMAVASASDNAMLKYGGYTPQELTSLSIEERHKSVPMAYGLAAESGMSKGAVLIFAMQLNALMYPAINDYESAVREYQKDLGDKVTGILTVSQIYKLEKRYNFQKHSRVFFPNQYLSYKIDSSASVQGTMMIHDEKIAYPVNHTKLTCYKTNNYCELEQLYLVFPKPDSWNDNFHFVKAGKEFFDITNWSENTIDAVSSDSGSGCRKTSLNLNFKTKEFYQITRNGDEQCEINGTTFPKLEKPRIAQIVDGEKIVNTEFSNLTKMAFEMLSTDFQNKIKKLIESEQPNQ